MSRGLGLQDLIEAAKANDCKALEEILQKFPSQVDYTSRGVTALQQASYYGHIEAMKILIRLDADLDFSDLSNDWTPLHYAVEGNQPMAVHFLLRSHANVGEKNMEGLTPPQIAYRKKLRECIKEFKSFDSNIVFKVDETKAPVIEDVESPAPQEESIPVIEVSKNERLKKVDDADRCIYCAERTAIITFRPCHHNYSCFECSAVQQVCQCGEPIEDRSIGDDEKVRSYIKDVKEFRSGYGQSQRKVEDLTKRLEKAEDMVKCNICLVNPIDCSLNCGHTFCVECVKKMENTRNPTYRTPYVCPVCKLTSRYKRLYFRWDDTSYGNHRQNTYHTHFNHHE